MGLGLESVIFSIICEFAYKFLYGDELKPESILFYLGLKPNWD